MFDVVRPDHHIKPMLAVKADPTKIRFPVIGSPKFDGVRCLAMAGQPMSRSMLMLPNMALRSWFHQHRDVLEGLDGELIIGSPTAEDCYRKTTTGVMTRTGVPDFTYYVFDKWNTPSVPYEQRYQDIAKITLPRIQIVQNQVLQTHDQLHKYETKIIELGYEGVILRKPNAPYKYGRSTVDEGYLLKIKRFEDAEATIVGYQEALQNNNVATISETGNTKRSSHQENKSGKDMLGAWIVEGLTAFKGVKFQIGTGMDDAYRKHYWTIRDQCVGKIVKFKYFSVGVKDAPRHPVYLGFRDQIDL